MLGRTMVINLINDNAQTLFMISFDQLSKIFIGPEHRINIIIINNIISHTGFVPFIKRSEPNRIHAQIFDIIGHFGNTFQVTVSAFIRVAVTSFCIVKSQGINLIDDFIVHRAIPLKIILFLFNI